MSTEMLILAFLASNVATGIGGIALHAWAMRRKSPTLTLDAIKAASALLAAAAKSAEADVTAANEHQQAVSLALGQAAARMSVAPAIPAAPPVA